MRITAFVFSFLFITASCLANVTLPKLIGDNMVLQREKPIRIWGWASPGEKVTVVLKNQSVSTKATKEGKWLVTLAAEPAGGPFVIQVKGKNTITLNNILLGEVWVCSGQSNMEWPVRASNHAEVEIKSANYPEIRHFAVQKSVASQPQEDVQGGSWKITTPENAGDFTAVGYFFAREVYAKTKVPIGLIHTSWGGTHSETWTSRTAFAENDEFKEMISKMPMLDLDALSRAKDEVVRKRLADLHVVLPNGKEAEAWKDASFQDSSWPQMKVPQGWENVLGDLDGTIWFRTSVLISVEDAGKAASINLSTIDDSDETFINGIRVGGTDAWNAVRSYTIPASVLKEGNNTIAIKVVDTGGGGGMYGEAKDMRLVTASGKSISLAGEWRYQVETLFTSASINPNSYPTLLFNAMLNPIVNFGIRGALWYQGESNAGRAFQYRKAFPLMIQDWRRHFNQGNFPFYFVQLASFNADNGTSEKGSSWAELREAQTMTLSLENTGMAVTTDIGEATDIHPRNKQDVGKRLAALALNRVYRQTMVDSGPTFQSFKVEDNKIRISFSNTGSGLSVKDKYGYLKGFEIAASDQKFFYAKAWLEGNDVIVSCDSVLQPVAVRFAWADNPEDANLFNKEGLPAVPFRTDSWMGITESNKFEF
jgi:sialate O-acetylesterase